MIRLSSNFKESAKSILGFKDIIPEILNEYSNLTNNRKIRLISLPNFGMLINGFRQGELTIFSGPTGAGKTTLLSQISLDYCMQGVRTLWGSFEIRNHRLGQIMLHQISEHVIPNISEIDNESEFSKLSSLTERATFELSKLPLFFTSHHGPTSISDLLDTLHDAVDKLKIDHVILDNLQFILSDPSTSRFDKFEMADKTISYLRSFCNKSNIHVTLVVHPRKEDDNTPLGISSLSGTSKASQEADNLIFIQKLEKETYLELKKNRYDGSLGKVKIGFDKIRKISYELKEKIDI